MLSSAKDGEFFEIGRLGNHFNNIYYTAATPFYNSDSTIAGYVLISSAASLLKEMWSELANIYVLCALLPLIIMFLAVFFITRRLVKPVNMMSKAAKNMSNGDFSVRIPEEGNDEIAELAKAFNAMSNSFSQLEGMRRSFVANVSHELRTPMTTIGGFIDGILDHDQIGLRPAGKATDFLFAFKYITQIRKCLISFVISCGMVMVCTGCNSLGIKPVCNIHVHCILNGIHETTVGLRL